uniref:Uncharacterized protein n=1 Tax=Strongyloides venezuelensis TaxID=75913 RepID=A0A0K0FSM8_STRVS
MLIVKGRIDIFSINRKSLLGPPILDSTRIVDNEAGSRETYVERKIIQMNAKLRNNCLQTRCSTELNSKFIYGAIVGSIRGHGHADVDYEYCLDLTALLTDIGTRYQDAQQFLVKI